MPQITLSLEQFRRLVQHLQNSPSTPTRLELADFSSETSEPTSEDIDFSDLNKVSTVPKRPGLFGVFFDPDIHDVFSFTSCLRFLQPRPKNISKYLRGDAVDCYANLSAAVKAGIDTCVGFWCHELEKEYRKTAGQSPVPQIPAQQASRVYQPSSLDDSPERVIAQHTPKSSVNHPQECRLRRQSFVSRHQLFDHLQVCRQRRRIDNIAQSPESQSEQVSITPTSRSVVITNPHTSKPRQCRLCIECIACSNQLDHHLQVSHYQTIHNDGTWLLTPDKERIVTNKSTPESTLDNQERECNVTTPIGGIIHSTSFALATAPNLWRTAAGARTSTSMETKPLSTKSPPCSSTSIPTRCRICFEKFASKSKPHQHLKEAHRFRNPEEREFQRSHPGRPITAH